MAKESNQLCSVSMFDDCHMLRINMACSNNMSVVSLPESDESDDNSPPKKYLADMMKFKPGHFACECVWRKSFILHSRLKMGPGRSGISRGECRARR